MSMDVNPMEHHAAHPPLGSTGRAPTPGAAPARTGAFGRVRARWLPVWVVLGGVVLAAAASGVAAVLGGSVSDELLGILFYLPILAWVLVMVGRRAGVDLRAMLRWPRLGAYWWVVAGMFVVQLLFSLAAATLTQLVFPGLDDALVGVGQGNLLMSVIALGLLPSFLEEVLFRGVLLERFAVKWRLVVAIVVAAVAFGILHADPVGAGMFGVVTALLYLRTGSLWPGILIHAANNALVLVASRAAGPASPDDALAVSEALVTAGVTLALSVPFLIWFLVRTWPRRGAITPYQAHEWATGLPERHVDGIGWSGAPGTPLRLTATSSHLVVGRAAGTSQPAEPIAVLDLADVQAVYPTVVPGGEQVVVLLRDGSWTTLQARGGAPAANRELALILSERADRFAGRVAVSAG
jgi:hypothetical protein